MILILYLAIGSGIFLIYCGIRGLDPLCVFKNALNTSNKTYAQQSCKLV